MRSHSRFHEHLSDLVRTRKAPQTNPCRREEHRWTPRETKHGMERSRDHYLRPEQSCRRDSDGDIFDTQMAMRSSTTMRSMTWNGPTSHPRRNSSLSRKSWQIGCQSQQPRSESKGAQSEKEGQTKAEMNAVQENRVEWKVSSPSRKVLAIEFTRGIDPITWCLRNCGSSSPQAF